MFGKAASSRFNAVWKDVCEAEHNNTNQGQGKKDRQEMWKAFAQIQPYFTLMHLTADQRRGYKAKLETWGRAYLKAFGEGAVTHYVVSFTIEVYIFKLHF